MYESIIDALRRGAHDEAAHAAREAIAAAPDDAQGHRWLAAALAAQGERDAAVDSINRALRLAPDDADLHFQRAGLLLGTGQVQAAQSALEQSAILDPNQFGAWILQAQLALGRNDLAEAERLQRLAARIDSEHPWVRTIEGSLALRRGNVEAAQKILAAAAERAPDDPQVRHALGFAYMAGGHHAFAEQAFRGVLEKTPGAQALHGLIAELMRRQGRHAEAVEELAPLLDESKSPTASLRRFAGELQLAAGRHELALPLLRSALAAQPRDRRTLNALIEAWRRNGDAGEARATLEQAIAAAPDSADVWRARLAFEPMVGGEALAVSERWLAAMPDNIPALEARMALLGAAGDPAAAQEVARRIVELQPGHGQAELRLVDAELQSDPRAAITHLQDLLARSEVEQSRQLLRGWLALAQDRAGQYAEATELWSALQAEVAPQRLPLPELTRGDGPWPPFGDDQGSSPAIAFLVGAPGSRVEQIAGLLGGAVRSFRVDRFGATPPQDALQSYRSPARLLQGDLDAATLVGEWRAALPARGVSDGEIVDWLLWWDNALLLALRPQLPQATLLVAIRDPRDMLLDWLAFGAPAPLRIESPLLAAQWLARELGQIAELHQHELYPHALIRLDEIADDAAALVQAVGDALATPLPAPPAGALGPAHFAAGHWRNYAQALAEPFARLTPVAVRLGYPET